MTKTDKPAEYVFIGADLTPRYEIVFERSDATAFRKLHNATHSGPIKHEAALLKSAKRYHNT